MCRYSVTWYLQVSLAWARYTWGHQSWSGRCSHPMGRSCDRSDPCQRVVGKRVLIPSLRTDIAKVHDRMVCLHILRRLSWWHWFIFFLKFHVVKYWYWYGICFVFQGCFGKSICFLFKVVLENRHPCWMEDFPKHVSSWRYEQEDEWNEFLERTDTSKVEFLCLEGWGFGLLEWNDRYLRYLR